MNTFASAWEAEIPCVLSREWPNLEETVMASANELTLFDVCCQLVAEYLRRKFECGEDFSNIHELRGLLTVDFGSDGPASVIVKEMIVQGHLACGNPVIDGRVGFWILRSIRDVPFVLAKVDATEACLGHRQAERYAELNCERLLALATSKHGVANVTTPTEPSGLQSKAYDGANLAPGKKADAAETVAGDELGKLQNCERAAYYAFRYAEMKRETKLTAQMAHEFWTERGFDAADRDTDNADVLKGYEIPSLATFRSQLSRARSAFDDLRNEDRTGRSGRSVVDRGDLD